MTVFQWAVANSTLTVGTFFEHIKNPSGEGGSGETIYLEMQTLDGDLEIIDYDGDVEAVEFTGDLEIIDYNGDVESVEYTGDLEIKDLEGDLCQL